MQTPKLTTLLCESLTIKQAKQIHCQILINGDRNIESLLVRQTLKSAGNCSPRTIHYVESILKCLQTPDVWSTSFTIRHLSQHGLFQEAFSLYVRMHSSGFIPNTYAVSSALKACAKILCKVGGVMIHGQMQKLGFCEVVFVQTALLDFYLKVGGLEIARKVFDGISGKNVVSWNSMLAGYAKVGQLEMAHSLFDEMPVKDVISWNSMVSGYGRANNMEQAYELFRQMPERNFASWNAIITGYVDNGKLELARSFFEAMPQRNTISYIQMISAYSKYGYVESAKELFDQMGDKNQLLYNAMIACFAHNYRAKEAIQLFDDMLRQNTNLQPDKMTLASVISACAELGDLKLGTWIDSYMVEQGIVMDNHLATSFIDLYSKCGSIDKAYELFNGLHKKDVVSYTAMILGCGVNGRPRDAIRLFEETLDSEITPNQVTYTGILMAYNHVGHVEEGYNCFLSMQKHGVCPSVDHYAIVVDLLGRAGRLKEAHELIKKMPMPPHAGVWGALLLACSVYKDVELAEVAASKCFELEPDCTGYRSLLANIYASTGRWDDAERLRRSIQDKGYIRTPGSSWTDCVQTNLVAADAHF
ncbi:pentatricopeptide repeat-containing protein-like [Dorcoceras hygrometricum]|uniref:Pentatricopeptide repeat-containing protein-like n=1 Tax=Dorcoceras hygrometricum TaxID=472368 RepID=A0A2Z7CY05_9LAMI|nr:pentatricopeptide repeat-containing protein-like [Dorcoceras hygrometricum]